MPVLRPAAGRAAQGPLVRQLLVAPLFERAGGPRTWLYPSFPQEVATGRGGSKLWHPKAQGVPPAEGLRPPPIPHPPAALHSRWGPGGAVSRAALTQDLGAGASSRGTSRSSRISACGRGRIGAGGAGPGPRVSGRGASLPPRCPQETAEPQRTRGHGTQEWEKRPVYYRLLNVQEYLLPGFHRGKKEGR